MKTGMIDVGGGMRGVYAAGVLDYCMEKGIKFDYCIGISAGAANMCAYLSGQQGRNYRFYTQYPHRKEYMSWQNFRKKGSYLDLEYVYGTLSNSDGEDPMDYEAFKSNPAEWYIIATNAVTGEPKYFSREDMRKDDYRVLMATCCIPVACKAYEIDGVPYYDGALSDPVPVKRAFDDGCDKVVLILTRPVDTLRNNRKDSFMAKFIKKKYPKAAEGFKGRADHYNRCVAEAKKLQEEGKVLILSPDDITGVSTLSPDTEIQNRLYCKGLADGRKIAAFLAE